jgi:predicted RNase H-like nuclease (RuvC/YqgF family)
MRTRVSVIVLGFVLTCLAVANIYGQQKSDPNDTSLGDVARQVKAQKAKEPKPAKVFTNDNISAPLDNASGVDVSSKEKSPTNSAPEESGEHAKPHDAEYFRSQMSTLQGRLDTDKRELDVLQQKLGQNQMQYYNDPNKSLLQQYSRDDIDKLTAEIDAKKQKVADDEKAIEDLHEQLRREGGDPGWLRQ